MEQRSSDWHEMRKKHIGASDAPVIMGLCPWKTVSQLWEEKTCIGEQKIFFSKAMQRGIELEPAALKRFNETHELECFPVVQKHESLSYMMASLDGYDPREKAAVEIKCPGQKSHEKARKEIPRNYYCQMQHQMEVMCLAEMFFFSYLSESDFFAERVIRDDAFIEDMMKKEAIFWECVLNFTPPECNKNEGLVKMGPEWYEIAQSVSEIRERRISMEEMASGFKREEDFLIEEMLKMSEGKSAYCDKFQLKVVERKGAVEYGKIPELEGVDLDTYRKPSTEQRRFLSREEA